MNICEATVGLMLHGVLLDGEKGLDQASEAIIDNALITFSAEKCPVFAQCPFSGTQRNSTFHSNRQVTLRRTCSALNIPSRRFYVLDSQDFGCQPV